jgi:hypothetical protein
VKPIKSIGGADRKLQSHVLRKRAKGLWHLRQQLSFSCEALFLEGGEDIMGAVCLRLRNPVIINQFQQSCVRRWARHGRREVAERSFRDGSQRRRQGCRNNGRGRAGR